MVIFGRHALLRASAPALAAAVLIPLARPAIAGEPAPAGGPIEVRAWGGEFQRFDPRTGKVTMIVSAARASASGESATLEDVRFVRYSPEGAPVLEATASGGRILEGGAVAFDGEVAVAWLGPEAVATFRSGPALWDGEVDVLSSEGPVSGTLCGSGTKRPTSGGPPKDGKRPKGERAGAFRLDVEGTGLEVRPAGDRGRILRDVTAVATGVALGAWRVTADGGLGFSGFAGDSPTLTASGPVGLEARGAAVRADGAEVALRERKGEVNGEGGLAVSRAWLTGTVHARFDGARAFPWGDGPVEVRAESAEIAFDDAAPRAILLGTESDPARVLLPQGVLRGTRVEIGRDAALTDGGARSELEWGGER
ncbi:MAG: hypothetical protein ACYTKD_19075 [Planctomycetota bacterium]|jgi:hypothetical protein